MLNLCTINLKRKQNMCSREEILFQYRKKHQHEGLCDFLSYLTTQLSVRIKVIFNFNTWFYEVWGITYKVKRKNKNILARKNWQRNMFQWLVNHITDLWFRKRTQKYNILRQDHRNVNDCSSHWLEQVSTWNPKHKICSFKVKHKTHQIFLRF